ncbi:MAG: phage holin family protein [Candidatus Moranbacteria bacterium]|nr:phage holin family protein [Candidatus Moranbacteria bacterium]
MLRLIIHVLSNAIGIWASARLVHGIHFYGSWKWLILAGAVLGLINFIIKPIIKLISLPLIWITLGLFTIVINVLLFNLVSHVVPHLVIDTWVAAFWAVIVISFINFIVLSLAGDDNHAR